MDWPQFRAAEPVKGTSAANNMTGTTWRVAGTRTHRSSFHAVEGFTHTHIATEAEIKEEKKNSLLGCFLTWNQNLFISGGKSLHHLSAS